MQGEEQGELAKQLQQALDARVVIEQAKGALVAREGLTPVDAFERLRTQARSERRRVADVAGELITALQRS
jgi:AmiR/NasT family two-component response regulator